MFYRTVMCEKIYVNSKLLETDDPHSLVYMDKRSSLNTGKWLNKLWKKVISEQFSIECRK